MEFRTDLRLTLKSSCDNCTRSKIKCSGEDPCERCAKKGLQCFYSPRKKRGPQKKKEKRALVANQPMVVRTGIINDKKGSIGSHERRSWSVFFTLYKHYAVSCSLFWFNRQLHKMRQYLQKKDKQDALKRLSSWMEALNIDVDDLAHRVDSCSLKIREWGKEAAKKREEEQKKLEMNENTARKLNIGNPFHLRVNGQLQVDDKDSGSEPLPAFVMDDDVASIQIKVDYTNAAAESEVIVNQAFRDLMGFSGDEIANGLRESGGGFLPWGADILSKILIEESDLLAFVQILAIKFNTMGKPTHYPIIREVPSCHVYDVSWKNVKELGPLPCMIKCVHRETIADNESLLEVIMSFTPMKTLGKRPKVDADVTVIEDHLQLPPKRQRQKVKKEHSLATIPLDVDDVLGPAPEGLQTEDPVIYNFIGTKNEIEAIPGPPLNNTIIPEPMDQFQDYQHQVQQEFQPPPHPPSIQADPSLTQNGNENENKDKNKALDYGNTSPESYPFNYGEEQMLDSLPFVDSSDDDGELQNDDTEWLDDLLTWAVPQEAQS